MEVEMKERNDCDLDWNDEDCQKSGFSLIGKLVTQKQVNIPTFRKMILRIWRIKGKVEISDSKENAFVFHFSLKEDYDRILRDSPWAFDGCLLNLRPWTPLLTIKEVLMSKCLYWVQIHNIPKAAMTKKNIVTMGNRVGEVVCFEDPKIDDCHVRSYVRVRIEIDLTKPLVASFWVNRPDMNRVWAYTRFEKLQNFCYDCGRVGHEFRSCVYERVVSEEDPSLPMYTAELRVNPVRAVAPVIMIRDGECDSVQMGTARDSSSSRKSVDELVLHVSGEQKGSRDNGLSGEQKGSRDNGLSKGVEKQSTWQEGVGSVNSPEVKSAEGRISLDGGPCQDLDMDEVTSPIKVKGKEVKTIEAKAKMESSPKGCRRELFRNGPLKINEPKSADKFLYTPKSVESGTLASPNGSGIQYKKSIEVAGVLELGIGVKSYVTSSSTPYIVELPEENDDVRDRSPLKGLLQLTYERTLVQELKKVCLKRALEDDKEQSQPKKIKGGVGQEFKKAEEVDRDKENAQPFVLGNNSPLKKKKRKGKKSIEVSDGSLVEVPVLGLITSNIFEGLDKQDSSAASFAEGLGGQPQMATKSL